MAYFVARLWEAQEALLLAKFVGLALQWVVQPMEHCVARLWALQQEDPFLVRVACFAVSL